MRTPLFLPCEKVSTKLWSILRSKEYLLPSPYKLQGFLKVCICHKSFYQQKEATEEVQVTGSQQESLFSKRYSRFANQDQNREKRGSNGEQMATMPEAFVYLLKNSRMKG